MDYFVISSDYPELVKAVEEIFVNVDTVNVISSSDTKNHDVYNPSEPYTTLNYSR